jgi:hypothetical protein
VVIVLVLLVVGGVALFGALSSDATPNSAPVSPASEGSVAGSMASPDTRTATKPSRSSASRHTLVIKVIGAPTRVYVTVSGNSQVLLNEVLRTGYIRQYDEAPLDVVVGNGGAVEVYIHGVLQAKRQAGRSARWHVNGH